MAKQVQPAEDALHITQEAKFYGPRKQFEAVGFVGETKVQGVGPTAAKAWQALKAEAGKAGAKSVSGKRLVWVEDYTAATEEKKATAKAEPAEAKTAPAEGKPGK